VHVYEVRLRKDKRGMDLISAALSSGWLRVRISPGCDQQRLYDRHAHSRATRHPHPGATSEGMSAAKATTVAATVGGSCDSGGVSVAAKRQPKKITTFELFIGGRVSKHWIPHVPESRAF
jgi:hypothetical protein